MFTLNAQNSKGEVRFITSKVIDSVSCGIDNKTMTIYRIDGEQFTIERNDLNYGKINQLFFKIQEYQTGVEIFVNPQRILSTYPKNCNDGHDRFVFEVILGVNKVNILSEYKATEENYNRIALLIVKYESNIDLDILYYQNKCLKS